MEKVLSVIIPVYNSEKYLRRCIESILNQTYKKFEAVIVDDGSTDHSYQLCVGLADTDRRMKVVHQEHKGVAYTRKTAVNMASGKYIVFVDSDDWIEPGYLDMIANHADHADALIVGYYTDDKRCLNKPWAEEGIYEGEALKIIWESMFSAGGGYFR